ncbi:cell division inhibitor, NAD(P)-binding protein [Proteus vulgaris]|uniref:TIGR01777 family oxidoreductase n=1 Tax=Proteus vulgaris TaxID=585 RepID=UPI000657CABF|nr:TIGR01777 family oxidoreductase [Proteus vulgaris]WIF70867.1 TIGR01777 family oxidoreductase [Proteus vulgaris]CRL60670.1 Epimerase family protein [Proteus vulgaris]SUC01721.1 cell division inhibitor, NAD(P)-binding protein [Proteus vulgaris]
MKILITGGTGLIGKALVCELALSNNDITVLSRSPQKVYSHFCNEITCWTQLSDKQNLNEFDAVINLAGEPIADNRWTPAQKQKLINSRCDLTQKLVELIKTSDSPPSVFISGSAVGFYGDQGDLQVTEQTPANPEFTHELCAKWESIALEAQTPLTRVCLLRTGIVLSTLGGALPKMSKPFKLGLGGKLGSGKQYMPWIHIDDMVSAIIFLLKTQDAKGAFNLTAPNPVQNKEFTRLLGKAFNRPALMTVPESVLRLVMGESATLVLGGQQAIPEKLLNAGFEFRYPQLEEALKDIITTGK